LKVVERSQEPDPRARDAEAPHEKTGAYEHQERDPTWVTTKTSRVLGL
jgi:hypothetical protein